MFNVLCITVYSSLVHLIFFSHKKRVKIVFAMLWVTTVLKKFKHYAVTRLYLYKTPEVSAQIQCWTFYAYSHSKDQIYRKIRGYIVQLFKKIASFWPKDIIQ